MDTLILPKSGAAPAVAAEPTLSVVVPVRNEEAVLAEFHRRLGAVLDGVACATEIVYVDDGSDDRSGLLLAELRRSDPRVAVIDLSRNFGKENAMSAGLDFAQGDAVIVIDADLQDPPELIPDLLRAWQAGHDVVLMRRRHRAEDSLVKRGITRVFYRTLNRMSPTDIPLDVGDFRLLSRRAVEAVRRFPERSRFMKGLFAWVGFDTTVIEYDRAGRHAGKTKYNYWRLWNFALEGITSFSVIPLKVASYVGVATASLAFAMAAFFIVKTLVYGDPVQGFPTLVVIVLFLGGLQLMALGIIGEYLARMFIEVKQRPLYLVQRYDAPARPLRPPAESVSATAPAAWR